MLFSQQKEPQQPKEEANQEKPPAQEGEKKEKTKEDDQEGWDEEYAEQENKFKWYRKFFFAFGKFLKYTMWAGFAMYGYHLWILRYQKKPEEWALDERFMEAAYFTSYMYRDLKELLTMPPVMHLLGDRGEIPPGYQAPKTLVLNVNGTLVHSEYKFGIGFEILKRPGLTAFINRMGRSYELALFGDQEQGHIMEIADALDPDMRIISGRLGRESTIMKNGQYIKDFSYLGRPLKDVVYIDFTDDTVPNHRDNCIILPEWKGERDDRALIDIVPFLDHLAHKPCDVRKELKEWSRDNTAEKFNRMQEQRRYMIASQREKGASAVMGRLEQSNAEIGQKPVNLMKQNQMFGIGGFNRNE